MKVTYPGPLEAVILAATDQIVERGKSIEVDADLGADLIAQGWTPAKTPKSASAAQSKEDN